MDNSKLVNEDDSLYLVGGSEDLPNYVEIEHRSHDNYFLLRILFLFLLHMVHFIADIIFVVDIFPMNNVVGALYFTLTTYRLFNVMLCARLTKENNSNSTQKSTSIFLSFFDVGLARMVSKLNSLFGLETAYMILCIAPQMVMNIVSIFTEYNIRIIGWSSSGNHFYESGYEMRPIGILCLFFKVICILNYVLFLNRLKVFKLSTVKKFLRDLSE